jgi:hypothetical protein
VTGGTNVDQPWDRFDSSDYFELNYGRMHDVDAQIIARVRDHFAATGRSGARGIDVGSGPNLYPAMALLPFCTSIDLWEYAPPNVAWLDKQITDYGSEWDPYWELFARDGAYRAVDDPRTALATRASVTRASLYDLPAHEWDMCTMFFVACSISSRREEFDAAVTRFLRCLRPGSPFAAAFMVGSRGYDVGEVTYPAVPVTEGDIRETMASTTRDIHFHSVTMDSPHREGFEGMLLATGRADA